MVSNPSYLHLKNKQLIIEQAHEVVAQVPIEDIGVLILGHSAITITQPLIIECQENNTAVIFYHLHFDCVQNLYQIRLSNNIVQPKLRNSLYHLI
jgi:CRISPR/Cas system-associated endonuclease Cas1